MGWSSGAELAGDVWDLFKKYVPAKDQKRVATKLVDLFENQDCDNICEVEELCKLVHNNKHDE
jgi:hypothetical protein